VFICMGNASNGLEFLAHLLDDFTSGQDLLLKKGNARSGNSVYVKITTPSIILSLYCNIFIVTCYVDHPQTSFTFLTF